MGGSDWTELALVSRVEQWVTAHPYFFMVSTARLVRPTRPVGTVTGLPAMRARESILGAPKEPTVELQRDPTGVMRLVDVHRGAAVPKERGGRPLVLPVRKVQTTFPSMITVGRTDNNDLVIADEQISKFHAFFRLVGTRIELTDAGSRNGTYVGSVRLVPRGGSVAVQSGDRFSFGAVEFQLFDPRGCWERLRQLDRFT